MAKIVGIVSKVDSQIKSVPDANKIMASDINIITSTINTNDDELIAETTRATNAEALKAPINSPTFTGTVSGVTKAMVQLGNADNTSDSNKPVSTAQATALALKLDRGTYAGTAQELNSDVRNLEDITDALFNTKLEKGTYTGTAQDLKLAIDNVSVLGAKTYQAKSSLPIGVDLPSEGTTAIVGNDPDVSLNSAYGVSGGIWVKNAAAFENVVNNDQISKSGASLVISNRAKSASNTKGYFLVPSNFVWTTANLSIYANTELEIRYNFNLLTLTVTLPTGVLITDEGGNITNGILNGDNLKIKTNNPTSFITATTNAVFENFSNYTVKSKPGTNGDSGWWTKVATINFGASTFTDISLTLLFQSANAALDNATVLFSARQNSSAIEVMYINLLSIASTEGFKFFTEKGFKMVENGFGNDIDIWVRKNRTFGDLEIREIAKVSSKTATSITYISNSEYVATTPALTTNYEVISDVFKFDNQKVILETDLKPTSIDNIDVTRLIYEGNKVYNLYEPYLGSLVSLSEITTAYDRASNTNVNLNSGNEATWVDNNVYFKIINQANVVKYYRRIYDNNTVDPRKFGADGTGINDSTLVIQKLLNAKLDLILSRGIFSVRNLLIYENQVKGKGNDAQLKFFSSGNLATDSTSYVVRMLQSKGSLQDIRIDGGRMVGNGLNIIPETSNGFRRLINNVTVENFQSYVPSSTGNDGYGVAQNKNITDLQNGIGGNGVVLSVVGGVPAWELTVNKLSVFECDGFGILSQKFTDSSFTNILIGNCIKGGWDLTLDPRNNRMSNVKIYKCGVVNVTVDFDTSQGLLIPLYGTSSNKGALHITGENNLLDNIELQENGSNGIILGVTNYSFRNSSITNLLLDGNGGIDISSGVDITANNALNVFYRKNGLVFRNAYKVSVKGLATDFRGKSTISNTIGGVEKTHTLIRQNKSIVLLSPTTISSYFADMKGQFFRIKTVGDSDFTLIQNPAFPFKTTVGDVFEASWNYDLTNSNPLYPVGKTVANIFGTTGQLETVNHFINVELLQQNQWDEMNGGLGYTTTNINGATSKVTINNQSISL